MPAAHMQPPLDPVEWSELIDVLLDASPLGIALVDARRRYVRVNRRMAALDGVPVDAHPGQLVAALAPAVAAWIAPLADGVLATGEPASGVARTPAGALAITCRAVRVAAGERALLVEVDDATARGQERAAHAMHEQQQLVDAIVENIPNMIFVKDARQLRFVRFNRAGEELLGYGRDELVGKSDFDFFPRDEAAHFIAQDRRVLATGRVLECPVDAIHTRAHGVRLLRSKKVPILDEHGQPAYLLGISEDITERVQTEAFRLSDLLVQSIEDYAIFLLDADGRVKTWNAGAERVTGYPADEVVGRPIGVLCGSPWREGDDATLLAAAAARGRVVDEGEWTRKDGRRIWRITTITVIRDAAGAATLFGTVTRDITERKRAEDEREHLLAKQREALRLRDEFLSVASHELRTPVTTLKLQAELFDQLIRTRPEELAARLPAMSEKLRRQTDHLERLIDDLLDVTRLASGRVQVELADLDLGELAARVVNRFRDELRGQPRIDLVAAPGVVGRWDATRIDQVLTNLLSNAVKYGEGRPVGVTVDEDDGAARLVVRDHGIGIAGEDQARIFGQFERAVSERNYGGLGLGLFIVRQIVDALGGDITVSSQPRAGSTFTVRLPRGPRTDDPRHR